MPDTILTLGGVAFQDLEVPERIRFGGEQKLIVHKLPGGDRVIDDMGDDPAPLSWSGIFMGPDAEDRARQLDEMRQAGDTLTLTWGSMAYSVVIQSFYADWERFYMLPYQITCIVIPDDAVQSLTDIDGMINGDLSQGLAYSAQIGDSGISGGMSTLQSAIQSVSSFAKATTSTINSVLSPLASVQAQVKTLIASTSNTIQSVTTLGGILPGNPVSQSAAKLTNQVTAMQSNAALYNLNCVLSRMGTNLANINGGASSRQRTVMGGNLYAIAQQEYGDASQWARIAQANNLTDPMISGQQTLTIPPPDPSNGGVYGGSNAQ